MRLWKRSPWRFCPAELAESGAPLVNPGRGWYQIYPFVVGEKTDFEELFWCLDDKERLALVLFDIGGCRERPLTGAELEQMDHVLAFFAEHDRQMILRVTYDREGLGPQREPPFLAQIQAHMEQIGPVIAPYGADILVFQGLFIGSWGEMHTSRFLSEGHLRSLYKTLKTSLADCCPVAVRKPSQIRQLFSREALKNERLALFDDGLFASDTHLGTFLEKGAGRSAWKMPWGADEELAFVGSAGIGPNGGEAVAGDVRPAPETVYETLEQMQICYLNRAYHPELIEEWKRTACGKKGIYGRHSVYDYIGCRLGYRFTVQQVSVTKEKKGAGDEPLFTLSLRIRNSGFGRLYMKGTLWIAVRACGWEERYPVETVPGQWPAGEETEVSLCLTAKQLFGPPPETQKRERAQKREVRLFAALTVRTGGRETASGKEGRQSSREGVSEKEGRRLSRGVCSVIFANEGAGEELFLGTVTET